MAILVVIAILLVLGFLSWGGQWLQANPIGWFFVALVALLTFLVVRIKLKDRNDGKAEVMEAMANEIERVVGSLTGVESYLSLRPGEKVFYERDEVQLREYKGTGSRLKSTYGGINIRATKNLGFSIGGSDGSITPNPEEQTTIDVGSAIFTNQRILFAGPNHSREFDFNKLIDLEIGDNGFVVDIAVSNRNKVSALAADSRTGITPGIMASICVEAFQNGEEAARSEGLKIAGDIKAQIADYRAEQK